MLSMSIKPCAMALARTFATTCTSTVAKSGSRSFRFLPTTHVRQFSQTPLLASHSVPRNSQYELGMILKAHLCAQAVLKEDGIEETVIKNFSLQIKSKSYTPNEIMTIAEGVIWDQYLKNLFFPYLTKPVATQDQCGSRQAMLRKFEEKFVVALKKSAAQGAINVEGWSQGIYFGTAQDIKAKLKQDPLTKPYVDELFFDGVAEAFAERVFESEEQMQIGIAGVIANDYKLIARLDNKWQFARDSEGKKQDIKSIQDALCGALHNCSASYKCSAIFKY